jgi:hypothetical protein
VRFEAYTVDNVVYSYCPACGRWGTDHHGPVELLGHLPPELRGDLWRPQARGPHYHSHKQAKLPHALGNAVVAMGEQSIEIDVSTTPYHFSDAAFPQWRALVKQFYGRSTREEPYLLAAADVPSWESFFEALGLVIESWTIRETCNVSS